MIELTSYDGYRSGDKISVMVSRVATLHEQRGDTTLVVLDNKRTIHVLESRSMVQAKINLFLSEQARWARKD